MPNPTPQSPAWLRTAVFYQVYPQSFADSNGDGIGDLPGLISKLPYLKSLGVTALWLNPIFESPFGDAGYDVADFRKVAPRYGLSTMPGVPFLYYGDEIGMRNIDGLPEKEGSMWRTGNRTPMQWEKSAPNLGFSTGSEADLYLPVDPAEDAPTVSEQEKNKGSLLHFTRKLIALRAQHSALGNDAAFRPLYAEAGCYPFVYERCDAAARFAIAVNPGEPERFVDLLELEGSEIILAEGANLTGTKLALSGVSFAILKLK